MRSELMIAVLGGALAATSAVHADTLEVGPSRAFATPCAAIAAAKPHDEIQIAAGTYTDSCAITLAGLTLRGVSGRPKIDLSGTDHSRAVQGHLRDRGR